MSGTPRAGVTSLLNDTWDCGCPQFYYLVIRNILLGSIGLEKHKLRKHGQAFAVHSTILFLSYLILSKATVITEVGLRN